MPKRQMDDIIEMIYALDKIAPGTANDDTLLYGVEVKFYNSTVAVDSNLETEISNLFVCDASVLPISPGKPPILTILALSKRLADYLK